MTLWFFPSNKSVFDMVRCLHEVDEIDQLCTAPYGQILYRMQVTAIFDSFDMVNKQRWLKYAAKRVAPRQGKWFRMKFIDNARPGFKDLQSQGLLRNQDMKTSPRVYRLNKERAEYLIGKFAQSKLYEIDCPAQLLCDGAVSLSRHRCRASDSFSCEFHFSLYMSSYILFSAKK